MKSLIKPFPKVLAALFFLSSCGDEDPAEVNCAMSGPVVDVAATAEPSCTALGSITATVQGGESPVVYSINGVDFQADATFADLAEGTYTITAKDANDCTSSTSVNLALRNDLSFSIAATNAGCGGTDGTLTVEAAGGSGTFSYSLDGGSFQTAASFAGLSDGIHTLIIKDGDCELEEEVIVPSGISFKNEVVDIIATNCAIPDCHVGTQAPDFREFSNIRANAEQIKIRTTTRVMPPATQEELTEAEIQAISCWVTDGALNN